MKRTLLIALLAMAGLSSLPAVADTQAVVESATLAAPENLAAPGKPCNKPGMGMGPAAGVAPGMRGMTPEGRACPKAACGCKMHTDMSQRIEQLEKRIDALQMTLEVMSRQQGR